MKQKILWRGRLTVLLQENWIVALKLNKYVRPRNNFDITASNIYGITDEFVTIRFKKFYIWPTFVKLDFRDIEEIKAYIKRKKPLNSMDILELNQRKSPLRKQQLIKTGLMKWSIIIAVLGVVAGISTGLAILL